MTSSPSASAAPAPLPGMQGVSRNWHLAWVVLMAGLIITAAATLYMKSSVERISELEFTAQCREIQNKITTRLEEHARILQSGVALFTGGRLDKGGVQNG